MSDTLENRVGRTWDLYIRAMKAVALVEDVIPLLDDDKEDIFDELRYQQYIAKSALLRSIIYQRQLIMRRHCT